MKKIDVNCLLGHWPFRKIYKNSFEDLEKVHNDNDIAYGYVSSLNSIFYHDPFEGDEELHEMIKGSQYKHILTINPKLPCYKDDIKRGLELFDIKGVRIYPGYHSYSLDNKIVDELCEYLKALGLPLFLTVRMEDERLDYILQPAVPSTEEISSLVSRHPGNTILLLDIRFHEIVALKEHINSDSKVFFDTSGLKDWLFVVEKLLEQVDANKMVYGSQHCLYCLKSSLLLVEKAQIEESVKEKIFTGNIEALYR